MIGDRLSKLRIAIMFSQPWIAGWFCAGLSVTAVVSDLGLAFLTRQPPHLGMLQSFLAFLPMCFYFMGLMVSRQQAEINDLRGQIAALKSNLET
jgi:hypothetical protein